MDKYWKENQFVEYLLNLLPTAIFWKNTESIFMGCNQRFADIAKLSSTQDIVGKSDYEMPWGKNQAELYITDDKEVIANKKPKLNIEEKLTSSDGSEIFLLTNKMPLISSTGKVMGILGIFYDISERKNMEIKLNESKIAAESANHAKTEFIANMSHDIRTPLTGVVGMSHILEDSVTDENQKMYAHMLGESGDQLLYMLNGILNVVSADNASDSDLHQDIFDVRSMVNDIYELEHPTTVIKGIELLTYVDESIPKYLISDKTKIHRILLNLIGNAIKFTSMGSVEVNVVLQSKNKNKAIVQFSVADTGVGISTELQDKIFDRFFRVSPSYKGIYTGHGIGLHIAQSYAHLLGGNILLTSKPGVGTTFYFDLSLEISDESSMPIEFPCNDEDTIKQSPKPEVRDEVNAQVESGVISTPTCLLVEDNAIALKMLECLTKKMGFNFISAIDGDKALKLATTQKFDLIITDIGLPILSGIDFTRKFREFEDINNLCHIPVIGLTAHADNEIKQECIDAGMNEDLAKPMTSSRLKDIKQTYFKSKTENSEKLSDKRNEPKPLGADLPNTEEELFELEDFPLLDTTQALSDIGDNVSLLNEILTSMVEIELPKDLNEIEQCYVNNDWDSVERIAHRMKGGLLYCGTSRLAHACQYLERYRKAGLKDKLDKLYEQMKIVADDTLIVLRKWLKK
ncbi:MAG: ATP-binding protein [Legionellaceae bacterium]|nr:ATP-binding protein [Legionellaceae bacterium]